jgi:opacity protein-like surface antigen
MRKTTMMLCVALLVAMTAAAAEKRVHKTVALAGSGSVSIDTHNGTVTVTTWNQPSVDVSARIEPAEFGRDEDVNRTEVRVTGSSEHVRIESDYSAVPSHSVFFFGVSRDLPLVHYTISMPAGARLDVDAHNATVRVTGLRNDIRVDTHNGDIDLANFDGGASIETHNGDVRVAFSRFAKGSRIETHNGGIDLRLPSQSRFHLDASGNRLGADSDFPLVGKLMDRDRYVGDSNGGGPELRIVTHHGSVKLRKV